MLVPRDAINASEHANSQPYRCRRSTASSSRRAASCAACACRAQASAAARAASRAAASWQTGNASGWLPFSDTGLWCQEDSTGSSIMLKQARGC